MKANLVGFGVRVGRLLALVVLASFAFLLTACQTMTVGKGETVYISVNEKDARIYLNNVLLSANSYATIKLDKSGGPYIISARKIGFKDKEVKVTSRMNWRSTGVAFVDNIFGVVKMGSFVYEAATGGLKQLDQHGVRIELEPK